jgi:hypothetical protein
MVATHSRCVTLQTLIYRAVFIQASHTLRLLMWQLRKSYNNYQLNTLKFCFPTKMRGLIYV